VRENLGDFRRAYGYLNVSFLPTACLSSFHKTNMLLKNLKKDAINELGIKY
jgi:hypothetical protein